MLRAGRVELRVMTAADLDRVDQLMMVAYQAPSRRDELALYLETQPDGWFVLADGEDIVAGGGAIAYGAFCWLGLIATDPARHRQGLATTLSVHLIEWARQRGCTTIALDASDAGRPVYERLGFQAVGVTRELMMPALAASATRRPPAPWCAPPRGTAGPGGSWFRWKAATLTCCSGWACASGEALPTCASASLSSRASAAG